MTVEVDYSNEFKRNLRQLSRRYRSIRQDLEPIVEQLRSGEIIGDQVSGVGHTLYKARVKNSDSQKGKSGGYRIVYYLKTEEHITLVTLYSKSYQSDVSAAKLRSIIGDYKESR